MSRQELAGNNNQVPPGEGMGYKKSAIGLIPEDWDVKQLKHLLKITPQYGINAPAVPYRENLPVYIRITDISENGCFSPQTLVSVDQEKTDNYFLEKGDLVFARTGASVGKSYLYNPQDGKLVFAGFLIRIKPDKNLLLPIYLSQYVKTQNYWNWVQLMSMRSGQPGINGNEYGQLPIPLPPLPEQKAIASVLSDVDELISSLDKLIAKKRHIKTATMQQLLTGKTRLPGFGEGMGYKKSAKGMGYQKSAIGLIPEDWEVKQIHQIIEVDPENLISKTHPDYEFKYISLEDVNNGYLSSYSNQTFSKAPSRARRILRYQDILFATVRPNLKSHLFFNKNESDWICSTGFAVLRCKENQSSSGFIFAYLFGRAITSQIETLISGSNYPAVNNNDVKHLKILLPPLPEQKAIASVLSDMDKEIAALEKRRAKTQGIKQGMMQELLTGRTRLINNYNGE
ncbi:restriction endonuclease subunit S [Limnospira platensis]|uniref:restriction endonuclease subunit S n=1 Tax=Limnospira platensis TaxID=118562 RepID=UPI003D6DD4AF